MASRLWNGSISFGLVNIPVSLVTAEARNELDFTLLDERDDSPIGYQKISKRTGKPVPNDRIVRGFEYRDGRYVIVSDVVKTRQHLAAVLVQDDVLVLNLLRYASELRDSSGLRVPGSNLKSLK